VKSKVSLSFCHSLNIEFLSSSLILAGLVLNGAWPGVLFMHLHNDPEAASYWVIGGRPRINSIVLSSEVVE
jgi:hypothetical protein